ncbi:LytTR family DNA-binding domain-containing protein [Parabacteroides sp. OttesenSCG-928-G07]|nr:LytTR family DNA-binding domain-containing protein [Parabacteroides sp. OttesenSCG-928-G07]
MKVLIIEDEKAAVRNLKVLLTEIVPDMEILAVNDSIKESIEWFRKYPMPELIFMDIHLADGSAFEIFEHVSITCPVIFTTAYDEYALKAFKVNSIDYLLKPIGKHDIEKALNKLKGIQESSVNQINYEANLKAIIHSLQQEEKYKTHFLISVKGDKLLPVSVDSILFFCIEDGVVKAFTEEQKGYIFSQTLDELNDCLNPDHFFRVNRQYIISRKAVKDIDLWFNSRLSINLKMPTPERILVSKAKAAEFKKWFTS